MAWDKGVACEERCGYVSSYGNWHNICPDCGAELEEVIARWTPGKRKPGALGWFLGREEPGTWQVREIAGDSCKYCGQSPCRCGAEQ